MEFQYGVLSFALSNSLLLKAFPFHIYSTLVKKGETKMKLMNLFNRKSKGHTALPPAPIQDENGNLTFTLNTSEITTRDKDVRFSLEGKTFSLNVNSE